MCIYISFLAFIKIIGSTYILAIVTGMLVIKVDVSVRGSCPTRMCVCLCAPRPYTVLDGYPASLGFPIMHRVHVICLCIHPCQNCHHIK